MDSCFYLVGSRQHGVAAAQNKATRGLTDHVLINKKEASAVYYTVMKHDGHLRTRGNCRKHEPQAKKKTVPQKIHGQTITPSLLLLDWQWFAEW